MLEPSDPSVDAESSEYTESSPSKLSKSSDNSIGHDASESTSSESPKCSIRLGVLERDSKSRLQRGVINRRNRENSESSPSPSSSSFSSSSSSSSSSSNSAGGGGSALAKIVAAATPAAAAASTVCHTRASNRSACGFPPRTLASNRSSLSRIAASGGGHKGGVPGCGAGRDVGTSPAIVDKSSEGCCRDCSWDRDSDDGSPSSSVIGMELLSLLSDMLV
ncbi:hypothetical protein FHETE_5648 [Fusarium heterosporum]|uniref:Uncharacterized protein n=1 Tax=Fusarium heterosporum TaxID=42747 RepID=A0A8H5TE53_FUSHE|nr:hypothetical protein FHETE_5648 [Fusarium heterosporum]